MCRLAGGARTDESSCCIERSSSIIGTALSPLDVAAMPPEQQVLGSVHNVCSYLAVFIQTCMVLYSTFVVAMMHSLGSNPAMTYRFLLHGGRARTAVGDTEHATGPWQPPECAEQQRPQR